MFPSAEEWTTRGRTLYEEIRDLDKERAALIIARTLMTVYTEGAEEISATVKLATEVVRGQVQ